MRETIIAGSCRATGRIRTWSIAPFEWTDETSTFAASTCSVRIQGLEAVLDHKTLLRPSDGPILDAEIEQRRLESEDAYRFACRLSEQPILAGDFNMPVDSAIYREYWSAFHDGFSEVGVGFGYTEWPRIAAAGCLACGSITFDGRRLAMPPLLGRARRGLRPSSLVGRSLACHARMTPMPVENDRLDDRRVDSPLDWWGEDL